MEAWHILAAIKALQTHIESLEAKVNELGCKIEELSEAVQPEWEIESDSESESSDESSTSLHSAPATFWRVDNAGD